MSDFGNNLLMDDGAIFPSVVTTDEQKRFVYNRLIPLMNESGLLDGESFSDLARWAISEGSRAVGIDPVVVKRGKPGRKPTLK